MLSVVVNLGKPFIAKLVKVMVFVVGGGSRSQGPPGPARSLGRRNTGAAGNTTPAAQQLFGRLGDDDVY